MPFSEETLSFLFENRLRDSKDWFHENKERYQTLVVQPFAALANALAPTFDRIDPALLCTPKQVSRIYRDTRFTKDKALYRDHLWLTIGPPKDGAELPCFYFELNQQGFSCGCGFYRTATDIMDVLRELILQNDKDFRAAQKALRDNPRFALGGTLYKRNHFAGQPEALCDWLNRRDIYVHCDSDDFSLLFSPQLADTLAADFQQLVPVYRLFARVTALAAERRIHPTSL